MGAISKLTTLLVSPYVATPLLFAMILTKITVQAWNLLAYLLNFSQYIIELLRQLLLTYVTLKCRSMPPSTN